MRAARPKAFRSLNAKRMVRAVKAALLIAFLVAASLLAYYLASLTPS